MQKIRAGDTVQYEDYERGQGVVTRIGVVVTFIGGPYVTVVVRSGNRTIGIELEEVTVIEQGATESAAVANCS